MKRPGGSLTLPEISQAEGVSRSVRREDYARSCDGRVREKRARQRSAAIRWRGRRIDIVIGDVVDALGGRLFESDFCDGHAGQMETCTHSGVECSVRSLWRALQVAVDEVLSKTTLQDLMRDEQKMPVLITPIGQALGPARPMPTVE